MALSKTQNLILELLKKSPLRDQFYWTGGTLLSEVYLHHRQSFDVDLFSEKPFRFQEISAFINTLKTKTRLTKIEEKKIFDRYEFFLHNHEELRLDLVHYDYPALEKRKRRNGIFIDSLTDLAANKTMALLDRHEPKDVVDIYFLMQKKHFTPKKLVKLVEKKFKVTISESTFLSEIMKRAENITSLQTLIFDTPKKQKTTLLTIQKYFKNASADFLAHHWEY